MQVSVYIKSHFRGNPRGAGEAAAIVEYIDPKGSAHTRSQKIRAYDTTRNALHLKICIAAMRLLLKPCTATIYIDCDYLADAHRQGWAEKWQQNGWIRANGKPPANVEDWKQFSMLTQIHAVDFRAYNSHYDTEIEEILEALEGGQGRNDGAFNA